MSSSRTLGQMFAGETCEPCYGLRDYQRQVVEDTLDALASKRHKRVVIHLPTGAGKTRVASSLAARLMVRDKTPDGVFVWLASAEELCEQAAVALREAWTAIGDRKLEINRFTGNARGTPTDAPPGFLVCSLSKLWGVVGRGKGDLVAFSRRVSGVVFDEAHQAIAATYSQITDQLSAWPTPIIGLTATPGRHTRDPEASERLAGFFARNKVTIESEGCDSPIEFMIREGYLAEAIPHQIPRDGVAPEPPQTKWDYPQEYHEALGQVPAWTDGVREAIDDALKRCRRIIVFAPSVATATLLADEYRSRAASSRAVVAHTPADERKATVEEFCREPQGPDDRRLLFNYAVFTAGFDAPATDAVVIGQPTKSLVRYSQMVGRALRGPRSGGSRRCHVYTITDFNLPGFENFVNAFTHWEELWQ